MPNATFNCPACEKSYRFKPELAGRRVTCKCGHAFRVPEVRTPEPKVDDDLLDVMELAEPNEPVRATRTLDAGGIACMSCGSTLKPNAILCTSCGTDQRTGTRTSTRAEPDTPATRRGSIVEDDGAPPIRQLSLLLIGLNLQLIALVCVAVAIVLGVVAIWAPETVNFGTLVAIAAGLAGLAGSVLCLFTPSPMAGRIALAASILLSLLTVGFEFLPDAIGLPTWAALALGTADIAATVCFLAFLVSLADYLEFQEISDDAQKVMTMYILIVIGAFLICVPFVGLAVVVLTVYAVWKYVSLLIDLNRAVKYRRDHA